MKPVTIRSETRERRLQTVRGHRSPAQRRSRPCRYGRSPEVTPGPAATFDHRPYAQSTTVASLTAAPKDVLRSMSCPKHFLTYRGVKMSRSSRNRRTSRRSRRISSRSSVRRPSLRSPPSRAACATQVRMAWDDGSNSRASSPGVRPDRTNSTICCRNAAGRRRGDRLAGEVARDAPGGVAVEDLFARGENPLPRVPFRSGSGRPLALGTTGAPAPGRYGSFVSRSFGSEGDAPWRNGYCDCPR